MAFSLKENPNLLSLFGYKETNRSGRLECWS